MAMKRGGNSTPLVLSLALGLGFGRCRGGGAFLLLALDDDLPQFARLHQAAADQLLDNGPVLLLVLVRQRVRVGVHADDDVLLAGRRVAAQPDGHFRHRRSLNSQTEAFFFFAGGSAFLAGSPVCFPGTTPTSALASSVFFSSSKSRSVSRRARFSFRIVAARFWASLISLLTS